MAQVTGRVFITVKGRRLASKAGAKLMMGGVDREDVIADTGVVGFSEKVVAGGLECTIPHTADISLADLAAITDVTASYDTDTGKSFVLSNCYTKKSMDLENGEFRLILGALSCKEV